MALKMLQVGVRSIVFIQNFVKGRDLNYVGTYFFLCYFRMIVHDKPRDGFIASGSCKRSLVFVKPVSNIRGNEQRRQAFDMNRCALCNHVIAVCSKEKGYYNSLSNV